MPIHAWQHACGRFCTGVVVVWPEHERAESLGLTPHSEGVTARLEARVREELFRLHQDAWHFMREFLRWTSSRFRMT